MESETGNGNRTTYICGICRTTPDQLSHHTAHINSKMHKDKRIICEYHIRRYVIEFLFLVDKEYWNVYLQNEYLAERMNLPEGIANTTLFENWIIEKSYSIEKKYHLQNNNTLEWWLNKYKEETRKCCCYEDKIDRILFLDWKIQYLIKEAETIQQTKRISSTSNYFDSEIVSKIDNDEISESQLIDKFINEICLCEGENCPHIVIEGNPNTTLNRHKKCNINNINLTYLIYAKFKNKFILKDVDVETIILGKTKKGVKKMWFIRGSGSTDDEHRQVFSSIKNYVADLLSNISSLEQDQIKKIRKDFINSGACLYRIKDLFMSTNN
jgi:hypothetical protein